VIKRETWAFIVLAFAIALIAFYGNYRTYDGKIVNSYPITINAADPASRVLDAEWMLISKRIKEEPPWYAIGIPGRVNAYPPLMLGVMAGMSAVSGVEIFDLYFFAGVLVFVFIAFGWFLYFKRCWNQPWIGAVAGLLLAFPFEGHVFFLLRIGIYANFYASVFFPFMLIALEQLIKEPKWKNVLVFSVLSAMQFFTNTSTGVEFTGVLLLYALIFHHKTVGWQKIIGAGVVYVLLVSPYLPLFYQTFFAINKAHASWINPAAVTTAPGQPVIDLLNVLTPILALFAIVGMIIALRKKSWRLVPIVALFYLFFSIILTSLGIGEYYTSIRPRFLLFALLYPLVAIGIVGLAQTLFNASPSLKADPRRKGMALLALVVIVAVIAGVHALQSPRMGGGLFSEESYNDYLWVRANTPSDAMFLCVGCQQFEGFAAYRTVLQPLYWEQPAIDRLITFADPNATVTNTTLLTELTGHSEGFPVEEGFLRYKTGTYVSYADRDVCGMDYFILRPYTQQIVPILQGMATKLIANAATLVHQSRAMVILKNNHKGGACL
jgi:hypothetical protein